MKIIVINKELFHDRPPVISSLLALSDLGHDVTLLTVGIDEHWSKELQNRNISIKIFPDLKKRTFFIIKIYEYYRFKKSVSTYLNSIDTSNVLLWVIGGTTICALGDALLSYNYVLQIQELHENDILLGKCFQKILPKAKAIFVNEYNRACIYQVKYGLKKRPFIIPNKPYFIDKVDVTKLRDYIEDDILTKLREKRVVLFQGQIVSYRNLSPYIKAAKDIGGYQIVLLGRHYGDMLERYKKIDPSLIHINRIPAPTYLAVTQLAHICLITYDCSQLNNIFCAPNKTFEYGAYSKPMIGNDIPGLKSIEEFGAGILVDESDIEDIKNAFIKIEADYEKYSNGAYEMYNSVDNKTTIKNVLKLLSNEK